MALRPNSVPCQQREGHFKVTLGNYGRQDIDLVYNQLLTDNLAIRWGASSRNRDGYLKNLSGPDLEEENRDAFRLALAWWGENTDLLLRMDYSEIDQHAASHYTLIPEVFEAANPGVIYDPFGAVANDHPNIEQRDMFGASLEINHDLDEITLTSITGWREFETTLLEDLDGSNNANYYWGASNPHDNDYFSQEFRVTGAGDNLKWTAGVNYSKEHVDATTQVIFDMNMMESFALHQTLRAFNADYLAAGLVTRAELAGAQPGIRFANRMGWNPFGLSGCDGVDCDGIFTAFFISMLSGGAVAPATILAEIQPRMTAGYVSDPWTEAVNSEGTYQSWALYGDATWALTGSVNLTLGGRYTYDEKEFHLFTQYQNMLMGVPFGIGFFLDGPNPAAGPEAHAEYMTRFGHCPQLDGFPVPCIDQDQSESWSALSGRAVIDWQPDESLMFYASVATGFKSGGFNTLNWGPDIDTSYDEEEVTNYEVGMKSNLNDGRVQLNMSAFHYVYDNLQELDVIGQPIPSYNLRNADAKGDGFELDLLFQYSNRLLIGSNLSTLNTEYTAFNIIEAAGEDASDDKTGQPRVSTPDFKLNLMAEYLVPLETGTLSLRMDASYTSERVGSVSDPKRLVNAYALANARINFTSASEIWMLSLWSTNLFDRKVITNFGSNGEIIGSLDGWRLPPRMVGVDIAYNF